MSDTDETTNESEVLETSESEVFEPEAPVPEEPEDYKSKYLRLLAEAENIRKRLTKEKQESVRYAIDSAFADLLDPIDNFETALKIAMNGNVSAEVKNWALGFQMILAQLKESLSQNGIVEFTSVGKSFDPHRHQALEMEETDEFPEGTVISEFVKGYTSSEKVIRPARVKVSAKKIEKNL